MNQDMDLAEKKTRFLRLFADLPLGLREEVIVVLENNGQKEPITWRSAYIEIEQNTERGGEILSRLAEMEII